MHVNIEFLGSLVGGLKELKMKQMLILLIVLPGLFLSISNTGKITVKLKELETKTKASIRALHVVNENIIWAGGSAGTILRSVNSGASWEVLKIPGAEQNDFRSIHAWDASRAMVFGVSGPDFGYKTDDGGKSWKVVFRDSTRGLFFNSLKFGNDSVGLAVSDPVEGKFFVIKTEDGGTSWEKITDIPLAVDCEANFAASNTCIEFLSSGSAWIVSGGSFARVFLSNDFGNSWNVTETPIIAGQSTSGIFSVSFKNDLEGVVVGGTYDKPELNKNIAAFTTDGGKTWLPAEQMPKEYRSCVQVVGVNQSFFFAVGKTGYDFSYDGKNWNFGDSKGFYTFRAVPGKQKGFAAGANGKVVKVEFQISGICIK